MKTIIFVVVAAACAFAAYTYLSASESSDSVKSTAVDDSATDIQATDPTRNAALASLVSKAPSNARVTILEPADGATMSSPVTVKFGIENMILAKAGDNQENSGHHHLLINLEQLPDMNGPLPATEKIIHFGGAQTETEIDLIPGEHTLQLLLGNYLHIPHDQPVLSQKITITVVE